MQAATALFAGLGFRAVAKAKPPTTPTPLKLIPSNWISEIYCARPGGTITVRAGTLVQRVVLVDANLVIEKGGEVRDVVAHGKSRVTMDEGAIPINTLTAFGLCTLEWSDGKTWSTPVSTREIQVGA